MAAAMPPTPHASQSFTYGHSHPPVQMSPGNPQSQPNMNGGGYNLSFDASSQTQPAQPAQPQSFAQSFNASFPNGPSTYPAGPIQNSGYARSFDSAGFAGGAGRGYEKPQIYTAVYSGVNVYEMDIGGIACMRRRHDGCLNATQILKVAGVDKGKRTKVLEKEILTGEHEKVQGGYGKYQGTWISYKRGREFCRQYGVEDILRPLLEYDVQADGRAATGEGDKDTPTKEQAMAANRKRFYNSSLDGRPNGGPMTNGTFFQNISPTTSVALAAMNKAARLNSPAPRPSSVRRPSQAEGYPSNSQQSMQSEGSFNVDSGYATQPNANGEPPRKRLRPSSQEEGAAVSASPTEPNDLFYDGGPETTNGNGDPVTLPPLPEPNSSEQERKKQLLLDIFADSTHRSDYSSHPALQQLSGADFDIPLDASANTALHWSATLARVSLLKLLIQRGASIWRGNAAGQSCLVSAVLVNNCWEQSNFPDILEILSPLIEVRDVQARTLLHHIAVSSGIKARAGSSKYYLEALLEFLVRGPHASGRLIAAASLGGAANGDSSSQDSTVPAVQTSKGPMSLMRFLSHIVNARDRAGNTALNLVARIGNRSIIHQLLEIQADPALPNHKGVSAKDFGVGIEPGEQSPHTNGLFGSQRTLLGTQEGEGHNGDVAAGSATMVEDLGTDLTSSMTAMLTQTLIQHKDLLRQRTEQIDTLNDSIRDFSAAQQSQLEEFQALQRSVKVQEERRLRVANLRRAMQERRARMSPGELRGARLAGAVLGDADLPLPPFEDGGDDSALLSPDTSPMDPDVAARLAALPPTPLLHARLNAYRTNNARLAAQSADLQSQSTELEGMYRKVVSLCTSVAEERVEEQLSALVTAVESERGGLGGMEVGRVREFLAKVDGVPPPQGGGMVDS